MSAPLRVFVLLSLGLAAACGGDDGPPPLDLPDAGTNVVTVKVDDHYFGPSGEVDAPSSAAGLPGNGPSTWVGDADGVRRIQEGAPDGHGGYVLHFPAGLAYAGFAGEFVVDAPARVDFGHELLGTPPAERHYGSDGTARRIQVTGLEPWSPGDLLWLASPSINDFDLPFGVGLFREGAVDVPPTIFDRANRPLGSGDAWMLQVASTFANGFAYEHIARAAQLSLADRSGSMVDLNVNLATPRAEQLVLDLRVSSFIDALRTGNPGLEPGRVDVEVLPAAFDGRATFTPGMLSLGQEVTAGDIDAVLPYGNPYPPAWSERLDVIVTAVVAGQQIVLHQVGRVDDANGTPIVAAVGPPTHLQVNGADALPGSPIDGHGAIRLDWTAPGIGPPAGYIVEVYDQDADQPGVYFTTATSLRVIDDLLVKGHTYQIRVTAVAGEGIDLLAAPHLRPGAYATADAISETFVR